MSIANFLAWGIQSTIVIAVAACGARFLSRAATRLLFWQAILVIALVLPAVQPWRHALVILPAGSMRPGQEIPVVYPIPADAVRLDQAHWELRQGPSLPAKPIARVVLDWSRENWVALLLSVGALRLAWLAAGLYRLRQLRLRAQCVGPVIPSYERAIRWYLSHDVAVPVTFGWKRPSILLPQQVLTLMPNAQEAIARHEVAHVERRDWLFVMAEETIRCALWFHPAIWFALNRIQLAREQAVDQEVVAITQDRTGYLQALMAVAELRLQPSGAPASWFLKRQQLASRVHSILREERPARWVVALRFVAASILAVGAAIGAVFLAPLEGQAQVQQIPTPPQALRPPPPPPPPPPAEFDPRAASAPSGRLPLREITFPERSPALSISPEMKRSIKDLLHVHPGDLVSYADVKAMDARAKLTIDSRLMVLPFGYPGDRPIDRGDHTISIMVALVEPPVRRATNRRWGLFLLHEIVFLYKPPLSMTPEIEQKVRELLKIHPGDWVRYVDIRVMNSLVQRTVNPRLVVMTSGDSIFVTMPPLSVRKTEPRAQSNSPNPQILLAQAPAQVPTPPPTAAPAVPLPNPGADVSTELRVREIQYRDVGPDLKLRIEGALHLEVGATIDTAKVEAMILQLQRDVDPRLMILLAGPPGSRQNPSDRSIGVLIGFPVKIQGQVHVASAPVTPMPRQGNGQFGSFVRFPLGQIEYDISPELEARVRQALHYKTGDMMNHIEVEALDERMKQDVDSRIEVTILNFPSRDSRPEQGADYSSIRLRVALTPEVQAQFHFTVGQTF